MGEVGFEDVGTALSVAKFAVLEDVLEDVPEDVPEDVLEDVLEALLDDDAAEVEIASPTVAAIITPFLFAQQSRVVVLSFPFPQHHVPSLH